MSLYRRALLVGVLAIGLAGCATLQNDIGIVTGSTVTPQQIVVAANSFDGLEATATTYLTGCGQKKYACQQSTINSIVAADRSGRTARNQLETFIKANPGSLAPVSNYTLLTTAIATLQGYSAQMSAN